MGAPSPTPRTTPSGRRIPEGYQSLITFAAKPAVQIWEIAVKPPPMDGGEPIDITTQHNVLFHTMYPRKLIKMDPFDITAAYDPDVIPDLVGLINEFTVITVRFPDSSTWCFHGWLQKWAPGDLKEGEFPQATLTIVPSCMDPTFVEQAPVFTAAAGT